MVDDALDPAGGVPARGGGGVKLTHTPIYMRHVRRTQNMVYTHDSIPEHRPLCLGSSLRA